MSALVWSDLNDALSSGNSFWQGIEVKESATAGQFEIWYDGSTSAGNEAATSGGIVFAIDFSSVANGDGVWQSDVGAAIFSASYDNSTSRLDFSALDFSSLFPGSTPTQLGTVQFDAALLGAGPIETTLVNGDSRGQSSDPNSYYDRLVVEYSDSGRFPTFIDSADAVFYDTVSAGDLDFVAFEVPSGAEFDVFKLADYAGTDSKAFYLLAAGEYFDPAIASDLANADTSALENNPDVIAYGHFGTSADSGVVNPGDSVLVDGSYSSSTSLPPGFYTMLLQQLGGEVAYQFEFGEGLVLPALDSALIGGVPAGTEDSAFTPISLPANAELDGAVGEFLTWSIPSGSAIPDWLGLNVNDLVPIGNGQPANLSTNDYGSTGPLEFTLLATGDESGNTKLVTVSLDIASADNDVPVLEGFSDILPVSEQNFDAHENLFIELSYDEIVGSLDISNDTDPKDHVFGILSLDSGTLLAGPSLNSDSPSVSVPAAIEFSVGDTLSAGQSIYWRPDQDTSGSNFPAFTVAVSDDAGANWSNGLAIYADIEPAIRPLIDSTDLVAYLDLAQATVVSGSFNVSDSDSSNPGDLTFSSSATDASHPEYHIPEFSIDSATGSWSFDLAQSTNSSERFFKELAEDQQGYLSIPVTVTDQTGYSDEQYLNITITGVNDAPELPEYTTLFITEGQVTGNSTIAFQDVDPDLDGLTYAASSVPSGFSLDPLTGVLTYDPSGKDYAYLPGGESISKVIDYTVSDGELTASSRFEVEIYGSNDAPGFTVDYANLPTYSIEEDKKFVFATLTDDYGASDPDNNETYTLDLVIDNVASDSSLEVLAYPGYGDSPDVWEPYSPGTPLNSQAAVRFTPALDFFGQDYNAFDIKVVDINGAPSPLAPVLINVAPKDDAPELIFDSELSLLEDGGSFSAFVGSTEAYGEADNVRYSISGPDASSFNFDAVSGQLELIDTSVDYEEKQQYDVVLTATDSDTPSGLFDSKPFTLRVEDIEDQVFALNPITNVFIPQQTTEIVLELKYSQDVVLDGAPDATHFSINISYDSQRLSWDPTHEQYRSGSVVSYSDYSGVSITDYVPGVITLESTDAAAIKDIGSLGLITFEVAADAAIATYNFDISVNSADESYEQLVTSAVVAPDAEAFIDYDSGAMDLSIFNGDIGVATDSQEVYLAGLGGVVLDYSSPITSLKTTGFNDLVALDQSLSFDLLSGEDTALLTDIDDADIVSGRLGAGRDHLIMPDLSLGDFNIQVADFELGLDQIITVDGKSARRRDQVLELLNGLKPNQPNIGIDFAAISLDFDLPGTRTLVSDQSSVIGAAQMLDPGSHANELKVSLSDDSNSSLVFDVVPQPVGATNSWVWDLGSDSSPDFGRSATLRRVPGAVDYKTDLAELRKVSGDLTIAGVGEGDLQIQWFNAGLPVHAPSGEIQQDIHVVQPIAPTNSGMLDFSQASPIKLELAASASASKDEAVKVSLTNGNDVLSLLSDALPAADSGQQPDAIHKAFGWGGEDLIIGDDGKRLLGGQNNDVLIAKAGLAVTQMSGDSGDDILVGGIGDVMIAGYGDDVLIARGSANKMRGGDGSDFFVLADAVFNLSPMGQRANRILDFEAGVDRLVVNLPSITKNDLIVSEFGSRGSKLELAPEVAAALNTGAELGILQNVSKTTLESVIASDKLMLNQALDSLQTPVSADIVSRAISLDQTF